MYKLTFCGKIFEAFPGDERKGKKRLIRHKYCIDIRHIQLLLMTLLGTDPTDLLGSANLDLKLVRGIEFSVTLLPMKNNFNPSSRF